MSEKMRLHYHADNILVFSYIDTAYLKGNKMENLIKKHIRFNDNG